MRMRLTRFTILLAMALFVFAGCENVNTPTLASKMQALSQLKMQAVLDERIIGFNNGVYYFDVVGTEYGKVLSYFLETHPDLEVTSSAPHAENMRDGIMGYFVTFRKNK